MDIYKNFLKHLLFQFNPETSHDLAFRALKLINKFDVENKFCYQPKFRKNVMGLSFPNPIGLAAGFDKNAKMVDMAHLLGFGFVEVGTITPLPQSGNPKPRVFRFPEEKGILNFMGFNNDGVNIINKRLESRNPSDLIIGANIGKGVNTELDSAYKDYVLCIKELYSNVDYFTLNISSPNTYGLRNLLETDPLKVILEKTQNQNKQNPITRPLIVKLSPDITSEKLITILDLCKDFKVDGVILTNTTTKHDYFKGGLSGKPLSQKSEELLIYAKKHIDKKLNIISSGGIITPIDGKKRFDLGANLIQLYTGLIYEGPMLPKKILESL